MYDSESIFFINFDQITSNIDNFIHNQKNEFKFKIVSIFQDRVTMNERKSFDLDFYEE